MADFGGAATVEIEASAERCFEIAAAVDDYAEWHPVIESIEVLERDPEGYASRARAVVDASVATLNVQIGFTYQPPGLVECRRESGDLNEMWTRFEFTEIGPGRARLDYSTGLDPGRMLSMMARGPVVEKVRGKLVDDALAGFKEAAEARS